MWRTAWFIARKDLQYMLRAKETLFWTFLMPIVFFFFIGSVTGGFSSSMGSGGEATPLIVESTDNAGFLFPHLERRLERSGFKVLVPGEGVTASTRMEVPDAFTDSVLAGNPTTLTLVRNKPGLASDYDEFRVLRAGLTMLADVIAASDGTSPPTKEGMDLVSGAPEQVKLNVASAGNRLENVPSGFDQAVPGTMVMFTLMILLMSGGTLLFLERKEGLLRRLASAPVPRASVVMGKWGGRLMLGMIQIAFAMIAGSILFKVNWGPNLPTLLVVMLFYATLMAGFGLLVGSIAKSEGQVIAIGVLSGNILGALGGCWWPIEITPPWMQKLALALPTGWAMDALHKLVSFRAAPDTIVPHLLVMALATFAVGWITTRRFQFQ